MSRWLTLLLLIAGATGARGAAPPDFSRYQIILERAPFGPITAAGAAEVEPSFAQKYQLVAMVHSNAGQGVLQAVLLNRETNRTYFRAEGETVEGNVRVVTIQLQPPKVVIQAGLENASLTFVERPNAPVAVATAGPPGAPGQPPQPTIVRPPTAPVQRIPFRRSAQ